MPITLGVKLRAFQHQNYVNLFYLGEPAANDLATRVSTHFSEEE
jgi:hypothetical protein